MSNSVLTVTKIETVSGVMCQVCEQALASRHVLAEGLAEVCGDNNTVAEFAVCARCAEVVPPRVVEHGDEVSSASDQGD